MSWKLILLCLQMREIIYSRDHRVNRHKFDGVDPVVLYPLDMFVSLYLAAEPVVLLVIIFFCCIYEKEAWCPGQCTHLWIKCPGLSPGLDRHLTLTVPWCTKGYQHLFNAGGLSCNGLACHTERIWNIASHLMVKKLEILVSADLMGHFTWKQT